jgi:small ligand-binding sensory domain FIST
LRETTAIEHWVGTIGIGICATGAAYFDEPAIAVMAASLPPDSFRMFPTVTAGAGAFRRDNGEWIARARPGFGVVHCDPRNPRTPALVAEIAESASVFLVGGLTSSRGAFDQVAGGVTRGGLSGVLFAEGVEVATGLSQGCTPIGPAHTITEGFDNVLVSLDDRPALEVLESDTPSPGGRPTSWAASRRPCRSPVPIPETIWSATSSAGTRRRGWW